MVAVRPRVDRERPVGIRPAGRSSLTVCHGCCCGTARKHPDVDHDRHRRRLLDLARSAPGTVRVRVTDCIDACDRSNVVVVGPSRAGLALGGRPVWLGDLLHDQDVEALESWLHAGGPGAAPVPDRLQDRVFRP